MIHVLCFFVVNEYSFSHVFNGYYIVRKTLASFHVFLTFESMNKCGINERITWRNKFIYAQEWINRTGRVLYFMDSQKSIV